MIHPANRIGTKRVPYCVIELALPGQPKKPAGVMLLDPETNKLHIKLRQDWKSIVPNEALRYFEALEEDLRKQAEQMGGQQFLSWMLDRLSNVLQISDPEETLVVERNFEQTLEALFSRLVQPSVDRTGVSAEGVSPKRAKPFVTHLPLYSLKAAATRFLEDEEVEAEGWVEVPENLRLTEDMFVARVVGRSMEPKIPDGSLCVFRHGVKGTRQGKILLVEHRRTSEAGGEYTVKRYPSEKRLAEDGWEHTRIVLEPLNPEFPVIELDPTEEFRVVGELVMILPPGVEILPPEAVEDGDGTEL